MWLLSIQKTQENCLQGQLAIFKTMNSYYHHLLWNWSAEGGCSFPTVSQSSLFSTAHRHILAEQPLKAAGRSQHACTISISKMLHCESQLKPWKGGIWGCRPSHHGSSLLPCSTQGGFGGVRLTKLQGQFGPDHHFLFLRHSRTHHFASKKMPLPIASVSNRIRWILGFGIFTYPYGSRYAWYALRLRDFPYNPILGMRLGPSTLF